MSLRYKGGVLSATPPTPSTTSAGGNWTLQQQMQAVAAGNWPPNGPFWIEDVFSTYLYNGTGTTQTINNGIDLSGKGGLVWQRSRSSAQDNHLWDTERGALKDLVSNSTVRQYTRSSGIGVTSFNSNGFTIDSTLGDFNATSDIYVSWTFRKQAKFFDVVTYTGNGSNRTISHSLGSVPGTIIIKRTDTTGAWAVYHRSLANTEYLVLNTTAAKATGATYWNSTTPTSTEFSLGTATDVNANTGTYVAYLFAHDAGGFGASGTDNVISCGSFTTDGSGGTTVTLGYEPQWVMIKPTSDFGNWDICDNMRGLTVGGDDAILRPNLSNAEFNYNLFSPTSTGFIIPNTAAVSTTYIYIAIRRGPMRTPTDATKVFSPNASSDSTGTQITTGFTVDMQMSRDRSNNYQTNAIDRLRGISTNSTEQAYTLQTDTTAAEAYAPNLALSWGNTGFKVPNTYGFDYLSAIYWSFRRAPGFFDVVCYTGTGSATTQTHNLGVAPELMIVKNRSDATGRAWAVWHSALANTDYLVLNTNAATATSSTYWNSTSPTSSVFSIGTANSTNESSDTFVAYLFASVSGVSKVGSYTGNGSSQTINCGFTNGARFVLIKRTDSTGDWYVFDSARGIVAGNDPYLLLNSVAAEVTTYDAVDTDSTGFIVNNDNTNYPVNVNTATYIFLAIA